MSTYHSKNGRFSIDLEDADQRTMFQQVARFQEIFEEDTCGKCGNQNIRFVVRTVDDNQYHELKCTDCHAKLAFGATKKGGGLFPKRKDKEGNWLADRGWVKWDANAQKEK